MTPPLWQKVKSLLEMKVKEESEKAGLKLNIHKTKIMESGPMISWQIDGNTMEFITGHGTMDWFQTGKGICHGCILSTCFFK